MPNTITQTMMRRRAAASFVEMPDAWLYPSEEGRRRWMMELEKVANQIIDRETELSKKVMRVLVHKDLKEHFRKRELATLRELSEDKLQSDTFNLISEFLIQSPNHANPIRKA